MGTYYTVGIVKEFNVRTAKALDAQALEKNVGERFNLDQDLRNLGFAVY